MYLNRNQISQQRHSLHNFWSPCLFHCFFEEFLLKLQICLRLNGTDHTLSAHVYYVLGNETPVSMLSLILRTNWSWNKSLVFISNLWSFEARNSRTCQTASSELIFFYGITWNYYQLRRELNFQNTDLSFSDHIL